MWGEGERIGGFGACIHEDNGGRDRGVRRFDMSVK